MQPFPVTCETCRARLKIRDASVIGEIHACPRCGGMVHIVPPVDWTADAPAESSPPASIVSPSAVPDAVAASASLGDTWAPSGPPVDFNVDVALAPPSAVGGEGISEAPSTESFVMPTGVHVSDLPMLPSVPPSLLERALEQPILLWGGLAAAMLFIGGFSTALWLTNDDAPQASPASHVAAAPGKPGNDRATENDRPASNEQIAANGTARAADDAPADESVSTTPLPEPGEHQVARPVVEERADPQQQPHDEEQPDGAAALLANQPALPELPPEDPAPAADRLVAASDPARAEEPGSAPAKPVADASGGAVLKFDPLNFDPLALGLSTEDSAAPDGAKVSVAADANLDSLPPPSADSESLPSDKELFEPAADPTITVARGPAPVAELPAADVGQQLELPVESIDIPAVSLAGFLNSVAELADVPITLDPVALQMAGVSAHTSVVIRDRNTTLEKLLGDTLKKQRLDFVARDHQIIVVRPGIEKRRSVNYELKDLVAIASGDAADLAELLQQFVAPQTWQGADGESSVKVDGTKLVVDQTHGIHYQVLIFFERLRHARDLTPRSAYPVKLLAIDSPYTKLTETLDETATFTFLPWTPLAEVVQHCAGAAKLTILVDWVALADVGLAPSSPISCSAIDRKWGDALTALLDELGLAWSAVDDQTIQITTQDAAERVQQIEFYELPNSFRDQFSSADALVDSLDTELRERFPPRLGAAPARLVIDEPSGRLIVLANGAAHRYLAERLSGVVTDHVADTGATTETHRVSAQPLP